ncbi:phytoene desaturase [Neoroseomonas oryzicola]|uniref:Phytoene dehydrogenase n=1 Tax=Neoroseomonas oryzicola TaxID=535904 RepID=A0A9X9WF23_9PROT|nr:phytoene desaturase [Neoroseomonas oryzicola]MBR0658933.1 phytoene desaturase [Neoroseomonas oryzicola]NKE19667.1 phytoene desaturase [Neoroseomonas oryzicola]
MNIIAPRPDRRPHAVVIGSGFGGLAAAVRLGARGYRVTVLERLGQLGGRARVFRQDGFTFDAGPTIVTAPQLFEELWTLCGRRMADDVTLRAMTPFYRLRFDDGTTFDVSGDEAAMRTEVARLSPGDVEGYERFMCLSAELCRLGFEELGDASFASLADMARVVPGLVRFGAWRSVYAAVARHMKDERLRTAFSFHPLLIGGDPFRASAIYALIPHLERRWGVHWAMGGTGRLVDGLAGLIGSQAGSIRLHADVAAILAEGGRARGVRLASGETIPAEIVVSNADSAWTYRALLGAEPRRRWTDRKLDRSSSSMGLFVWYFGTKKRFEDVGHHTILLGPRYRGLLRDIFRRKVLAPDVSLYLHRPTASDPAMAPSGCDAFYVLAPVPNLQGEIDWRVAAEPLRRRIAQRLHETVLPGFEAEIVTSRMLTPVDFRDDLLAWRGSGFGLEPVLTQSAWFRPHNRSEELEGLYLVGAGTHPGAGLPGVLSSARVLDRLVPHAHALA